METQSTLRRPLIHQWVAAALLVTASPTASNVGSPNNGQSPCGTSYFGLSGSSRTLDRKAFVHSLYCVVAVRVISLTCLLHPECLTSFSSWNPCCPIRTIFNSISVENSSLEIRRWESHLKCHPRYSHILPAGETQLQLQTKVVT